MTIEEQLLINLYAGQKVYNTRILDLLCGIMEKLDNINELPNGMLSELVRSECEQEVIKLIANMHQYKPDNIHLSAIHGIPDEIIKEWLNKSVTDAFQDDQEGLLP